MELFYAHPSAISEGNITIAGEEHHHLAHVLRKREGDDVFIVDGCRNLYRTILHDLRKEEAVCRITESVTNFHERAEPLVLAQALLKQPSKMDWIVEKATELGVTRIIPMTTKRTLVSHGHEVRWRRIALAAMKQSLRSFLPVIEPVQRFEEALAACDGCALIICHEQADSGNRLRAEQGRVEIPVGVFIGPEGGFSDDEIRAGTAHHAAIISLGERRLRSETAALVALSTLTV
jgi:16S rRNA (uracil1498-N3)-methyltransferase